jgi:hypothetical protein
MVEVFLTGEGIDDVPPAPATPTELKDYFNDAVADGDIVLVNQGFSELVNLASEFFEKGKYAQACRKLQLLYDQLNNEITASAMISGDGVDEFIDYLIGVMDELGCS